MKRYMQSSYTLLSFVIFLVVWEGVAFFIDNSLLFPRLLEIVTAIKFIVRSKEFGLTLWNTLSRLFLSVSLTAMGSVVVAVLSYRYPLVEILLKPFIIFMRAVPTIAIIILVLIWSSTENVPIVVGVLILFPVLYEGILGALYRVDKNLLKMSKVFKVPKLRVVKDIYVPSVYNSISTSFPAYMGLTFKVIIAGEVLSQESLSIGGEIFLNKIYLESSNIFAWIVIVIVLNYFLEQGLRFLNHRVCRWKV